MNVAVAMTVLAAVALVWIWAPSYPTPERHEWMRAMDALGRRSEPCWACRGTGETEGLGGHPGRCWECKGRGEVESDG